MELRKKGEKAVVREMKRRGTSTNRVTMLTESMARTLRERKKRKLTHNFACEQKLIGTTFKHLKCVGHSIL